MMGLEKLGEKLEDPSHDRAQYHLAYTHVSPVKKHLSEFCRFVDFYTDISPLYSSVHSASPLLKTKSTVKNYCYLVLFKC